MADQEYYIHNVALRKTKGQNPPDPSDWSYPKLSLTGQEDTGLLSFAFVPWNGVVLDKVPFGKGKKRNVLWIGMLKQFNKASHATA